MISQQIWHRFIKEDKPELSSPFQSLSWAWQKHSWHKGAPAAFCHLLSLKQIKHKIRGSSSLPAKSLFISQERKKKSFLNNFNFLQQLQSLEVKGCTLPTIFFFPFREKNHLEASLHLAPKETILKKLSRCSMLFFLNKRPPLEREMRITWQILNILPPLSPLSPLVPAQIQHTRWNIPQHFGFMGRLVSKLFFKKA